MVFIQKLGIQGVRSFSPDKGEDIDFFPLTIILGENGAGKTTIIESLKFACCGQLPPNCNGGRSFVHDIHMEHGRSTGTVLGQIRLRFQDTERKATIITRTLETSLKNSRGKAQLTFKQLNSTIKRNGKSICQGRGADTNSLVLELLGVSKAILSNVIFCHQEETIWPLSDGKMLKEKFDDIFGSIGYVKALEKIKKTREEAVRKHALIEKDIDYVSLIRSDLESKRREVKEESIKLTSEKEKIRQLTDKLADSDALLNDYIEKESKGEAIQKQISQLSGSIEAKKSLCTSLQKSCGIEDVSELKAIVEEDCESTLAGFIEQKKKYEEELKTIEFEYDAVVSSKQEFAKEEAKVGEFEKLLQRYSAQRDELILKIPRDENELAVIMTKLDNKQSIDSTDVQALSEFHRNKIASLQELVNEETKTFQQLEAEVKMKLDGLKNEQNGKLHEQSFQQKAIQNIREELQQIDTLIGFNSTLDLKALETEIAQLTEKMKLYGDEKEEDLKTKIEQVTDEVTTLKDNINQLDKSILSVESFVEQKSELESSKTSLEDKLTLLETKNQDVFKELHKEDSSFYDQLSCQVAKVRGCWSDMNASLQVVRSKYISNQSRLKSLEDSFQTKQDDQQRLRAAVSALCDIDHFEDIFAAVQAELTRLREEKSKLDNIGPLIDLQMSTISESKICPVCEHDLTIDWTSSKSNTKLSSLDLVTKLSQKKSNTPAELTKLTKEIKEKEERFECLLRAQNDIKSIVAGEEKLKKIRDEIDEFSSVIESAKEKIDMQKLEVESLEKKLAKHQNSLPDAREYDNVKRDLAAIKARLFELNSKYADVVDKDAVHMKATLKEKIVELANHQNDLNQLQSELACFGRDKGQIQKRLQTIEREKFDYEKHRQNEVQAVKRQVELNKTLQEVNATIEQLKSSSDELTPKIKEATLELNNLKKNYDCKIKSLEETITTLRGSQQRMETICQEIDKYAGELSDSMLKSTADYLNTLNEQLESITQTKKNLSNDIAKVSKGLCELCFVYMIIKICFTEVNKSELRKKKREDCERLLSLQEGLKEQQDELTKLTSQHDHLDLASIKHLRIQAERDSQSLLTKKQACGERSIDINKRLMSLRKEMASSKYANVESKYRDKMIDKTLSELCCDDLNKYYKALDYSITTFHHTKMQEINKLLKSLWSIAYQGKDIDYIEIVSDEGERSAADRRAVYNYRVVMVQRGVPMDMKGHCSAGQKMLACLVIRLALAIIFCQHFPVITLDEPTTNLDKQNIQSFAKAITSLAKSHKNFQIIVITHDPEFLKCLGYEAAGGSFYRIFKNARGYSTIVRVDDEDEDNLMRPMIEAIDTAAISDGDDEEQYTSKKTKARGRRANASSEEEEQAPRKRAKKKVSLDYD